MHSNWLLLPVADQAVYGRAAACCHLLCQIKDFESAWTGQVHEKADQATNQGSFALGAKRRAKTVGSTMQPLEPAHPQVSVRQVFLAPSPSKQTTNNRKLRVCARRSTMVAPAVVSKIKPCSALERS